MRDTLGFVRIPVPGVSPTTQVFELFGHILTRSSMKCDDKCFFEGESDEEVSEAFSIFVKDVLKEMGLKPITDKDDPSIKEVVEHLCRNCGFTLVVPIRYIP